MLPNSSGLGLKPEHFSTIVTDLPSIGWFEVHPENYMGDGGPLHKYLTQIRSHYPLSMHGVGLSLGSADGVRTEHLQKLKYVVDRYQPEQVSEHLSWSHWNQIFLHDLLPLPYTNESLQIICNNIDKVQNYLGRDIIIENPSTYIDILHSDYNEPEFLNLISDKTACGILLDINNVYVCSQNHNFDPTEYLNSINSEKVQEIHLAGHTEVPLLGNKTIRIDDHGSSVSDQVWSLFSAFIRKINKSIPVLVEWDSHIPEFCALEQEAQKARCVVESALANSTSANH